MDPFRTQPRPVTVTVTDPVEFVETEPSLLPSVVEPGMGNGNSISTT